MYEQLSLFDMEECEESLKCKDCHLIKLNYYKTEGKLFDYCTKKEMFIDRCLTEKELMCKGV